MNNVLSRTTRRHFRGKIRRLFSEKSASRTERYPIDDILASELERTTEAVSFVLPEQMCEDFMDEGFVFIRDGKIYAYKNKCVHVTLPLDLDDSDFFSEEKDVLVCKAHGATYAPTTGVCLSGPPKCKGRRLARLRVEREGDELVLVSHH
jgi:nitrite reductase/ring-hydroxylating ferredoxin subunit